MSSRQNAVANRHDGSRAVAQQSANQLTRVEEREARATASGSVSLWILMSLCCRIFSDVWFVFAHVGQHVQQALFPFSDSHSFLLAPTNCVSL